MSDELITLAGDLLSSSVFKKAGKHKTHDFKHLNLNELHDTIDLVTPATAMLDAFQAWAAKHAFDGASIAILRRGKIVGRAAYGAESATERNEFASCSKLITGLCIAQLVRQGKLGFGTTMEEIFGSIFKVAKQRLPEFTRVSEPRIIDIVSKLPQIEEKRAQGQKVYAFAEPAAQHGATHAKLITIPVFIMFPDWFRSLTVTEVMTHTSGIRGDIGEGNPYDHHRKPLRADHHRHAAGQQGVLLREQQLRRARPHHRGPHRTEL